MPAPDPTDRRLRASIYHLARVYLEIERGLRDPQHLEAYLTPAEYRRHRARPTNPAARTQGPVLPTDIGHIHLDRHLPGQITATLPTRETDRRWGALVLHVARNPTGQWRIDQLERLTRPGHLREHAAELPEHDPLPQRIRHVTQERDLAAAADRAATSRLGDLQPGDRTPDSATAIRHLREQQHTWQRHHRQLDHELTLLRETHQLRQQLGAPDPLAPDDPATALTHEQLLVALGPVPEDGWRTRLWDSLADEIRTYRQRWQVTDPRTVLGPETDHPAHHQDRDELAATLRASARALGTAPPDSHQRDQSTERDHGRGLAAEP